MLKQFFKISAGPASAISAYCFALSSGFDAQSAAMAAVVMWVGIWWMLEPVHLAVTSLLPFLLLPVFGVLKTDEVAMQYMDPIIFLFIGGFFLAYSMEKWRLHERIAYSIILKTGNRPSRILFGIMISSYLISMWVSNTATVMMLLAAVLAIVKQKELYAENSHRKVSSALLIGLSFSATIGGMATPVGTPPNMIFAGFYAREFPNMPAIDFVQWMKFGVPFSFVLLVVCYTILRLSLIPKKADIAFDMSTIRNKLTDLNKPGFEEKVVAIIFGMTVLLWLFRDTLNFGAFAITGWTKLLGTYGANIKDSSVVVFTSMLLFFIPSKNKKGFLLDWKDTQQLPLSIILLFGSGFALAAGFERSGLSVSVAQNLALLKGAQVWMVLLGIALAVTILSEFASNTATVQLVLPVIIPLAATLQLPPLLLMLTATFAASLGYMLPVATSANTIVYGSGEIKASEMMRAGFLLDVVGILLLLLFMWLMGNSAFGFTF